MNKKLIAGISSALLALVLAGCGQNNLTAGAKVKKASGMVALVKGRVNKDAKVSYKIDDQKAQDTKNTDGSYVIEVPSTTKDQKITINAKNGSSKENKQVTVKAEKRLSSYSDFKNKYNQAIVGMNMSKADQAKAQSLQKEAAEMKKQPKVDPKKLQMEMAKMPADKRAAEMKKMQAMKQKGTELKKEGQQLQDSMDKIKKDKKDDLLPDHPATGVSYLVKKSDYQLRGNYQNGDLMGLTVIASNSAMKHKTGQKDFGTAFGISAKALGADPKSVMKQFKKFKKDAKSGQTTMKTIKSNGVKFNIGVSASDLYIYVTK